MSENNERPSSNRRVWIIVLIVVLALSCACVSTVALGYGIFRWADITKGDWSPNLGRVKESAIMSETFKVGSSATIDISNEVGEIRVIGTDETVVTIEATLKAYGRSQQEAADILQQIQVDMKRLDNGSIVIDARVPENLGTTQSPNVDLEITVPANCDVRIRNDVGSISINGVTGSFDVRESVGEIRLDKVELTGNSTIKTQVGEIQIELPSESSFYLEAQTGVGDISCDFDVASEGSEGWGPASNLEGSVGRDPEIRLELTTGTGAIAIKEY